MRPRENPGSLQDAHGLGLIALMRGLLSRRRGMCPMPVEPEQMRQAIMSPDDYENLKIIERCTVLGAGGDHLALSNTSHAKKVALEGMDRTFMLRCEKRWVPDVDYLRVRRESPFHKELCAWVERMWEIHIENQTIEHTFGDFVVRATTWKQVMKAMPEAMKVLATAGKQYSTESSHLYKLFPDTHWHVRRAMPYLQATVEQGGARARITLDENDMARIETANQLMDYATAQAVMLPVEFTNRIDDSPFGATWVS